MLKKKITTLLRDTLNDLDIPLEDVSVDYPTDASHGDYATNVALVAAKKAGKNPMELAEEIVEKLGNREQGIGIFNEIHVAKPGFINFWVSSDALIDGLNHLEKHESEISGKKIMVEFAHPNTHKEMHIGHMRTLITGESLSRLLEAVGADVYRANYQGDIGPHVAKAMFGIQELMRNMEKEKNKSFNEIFEEIMKWDNKDKAHFLGRGYAEGVKLYESEKLAKEIDEVNAFLYQKCAGGEITSSLRKEEQEKVWNLYRETRQWSLDYYDEFYERFYTKFKRLFFESEMVAEGPRIVNENIGKVFEKSGDTVIFPGEKYGLHTRVFITAKGYPTYEGKEMANAYTEYKAFQFDKKIHVVANEQAGYFKVIFKALDLIDPERFAGKQEHLSMGMVQLKDRKMSSRTGDVLTVDWLLDQVKERIEQVVEEGRISSEERERTIEQIAIGAVKYSVLKVGATQDVAFDIESSVSLDGNSGPYLQYTYARTQSVLRKGTDIREQILGNREHKNNLYSPFPAPHSLKVEERDVLRLLSRFPEVVEDAALRYAPNVLCTYLFEVSQAYNLFYQKFPILKSEEEIKNFRLYLTAKTGEILKNGLGLLGIKAPEQM